MRKKRSLRLEDRSTLHEKVCRVLREAIITGDLAPGDRLVQEELAVQLGVSRMPIREALRQLESEGLIVLEPHRGAIVRSITINEVKEIYTLRAVLEGMAVRISVPLLEEKHLARLEQLLAEMEEESTDVERFCSLNIEFHQTLTSGCGWERLKTFVEMLGNGFPNYTPLLLPDQVRLSNREHREIMQAVWANEVERAAELMSLHIRRTGEQLAENMESLTKLKKEQPVIRPVEKMNNEKTI